MIDPPSTVELVESGGSSAGGGHTRYNITGIHSILIFNEAEAVHQLDLGNLSGAMGAEVFLDILFGDF
jgi:hypothetical protein